MKIIAILVAAGRGARAGGGLAKQWRSLLGQRVFDWSYAALAQHPDISEVIAVVAEDGLDQVPTGVTAVLGGDTRAASVRAGLEAAQARRASHVLIHDAARAAVPQEVITGVIRALKDGPAAAPGLAVTDALWRGAEGRVQESVARDGLFRAQTPQGFALPEILAAHQNADPLAADDVEIARAAGLDVRITEGHEDNIKITYPEDFARAERILRGRMDIRVGNGFDVHAFEDGDGVVLCGVTVPHDKALKGHSDADVAMHTVTDAIYGALADGDIGQHFPPSDPQWKGAASEIFLRHACDLARSRGYEISNVDCTIICERPKIGPHAPAMRARMAELLRLDETRISIKATTSERLGFTGREEGIAAMATVTLVGA